MIPLWSLPMAVTCGNSMLLKPSERDPGAAVRIVELLHEAGCPPGVVNVVHGKHNCVNALCDDPNVRAISFVGGDKAGRHIHARGTQNGKRVQCNMAAKVELLPLYWRGGVMICFLCCFFVSSHVCPSQEPRCHHA